MKTRRFAWLLAAWLLAAGCGGEEPPPAPAQSPAPAPYRQKFSGGPVSLTVALDRTALGLADQARLEQVLTVESGFESELPEFDPEDYPGFSILDIRDEPPEEAPGATRRRRRLTLEPDRSGELVLPPQTVYFRREGEEAEQSFASDELTLRVERLTDPDALSLPPLRGRLEAPPAPGALWPWYLAGAAALALLALVVVWRLRRGKPGRVRLGPSPYELALEALHRLVKLRLAEKGELDRFFILLSGILRQYIERRFGVRAPEQTTEEFLIQAARHPRLKRHQRPLADFLDCTDLVKFATHRPPPPVIQRSFDTVKDFLAATSVSRPGGNR